MNKIRIIWKDGKFVKWQNAKIHVLSHTLHYGAGVFEGIRFYKTGKGAGVFRLKEHIARLYHSAKVLQMKIPYSEKEFCDAVKGLIRKNKADAGYIRPLCIYGYGKNGVNPEGAPVNCIISLMPWKSYLDPKGIRVKTSSYMRLHPRTAHMEAKICGHYFNSILAIQEARKQGYDEALLLDYKGNVSEGPSENIFIVKDKKLFTPKLGAILPGITRDSVIKIAKDLGYGVAEKDIKIKEVVNADEAFFTGTAAEFSFIKEVDGKLIGNGKIGKITKELQNKFSEITKGKNKKFIGWLDFV